jgi:hypothetical protein
LFTAIHFPFDTGLRKMEALGQAREVFFTVGCIDDGEFQGRTAAVKDQY